IASNLANGCTMAEAVRRGKDYVTMAIEHALELGKGCGPTNHFYDLYQNGLKTL
ncbi:MAG: bifunctional hydroxymethylpyrimidine kinase/phosphomethylpyrimidine kinase, partial [Ruminococcus bromii]|nr:bifunctional hydroxymethylpyrimidine kinase/phosphomethylpyrimidine kinase [Ruminococcus bromii]